MLDPGQLEPQVQGQHRAAPVGRYLPGGRGRSRSHRPGPRQGPLRRREAHAPAFPPDPGLRAASNDNDPSPAGCSMARAERVGVIVPAAGDGRRLGATRCKALVELDARPLLVWALAGVEANDRVDSVVVVANAASIEAVASVAAAGGFAKVSAVVAGGPTRRASVAAGLDALPPGPGYVAVHDACRPLLRPGAIDRLAGLLDEVAAQGPGLQRVGA